jgi:UDP-arabinose 4-epimerase
MLPVAYDNLVSGHDHAVRWGPLLVGDIADRAKLREAFASHPIAAVIHFAGHIDVAESVREPGKYYQNNVLGTLALLDIMRTCGVGALVFSSSAAVYGIPERTPIDEDCRLAPINPYGRSKLMVEEILDDYFRAYGLRSVALRYFNAAGADRDGEIGEEHDPETHLIPRALMAASGELPQLEIFGDDYDTPDGTCVRDYVHVEDLAQGHVAALRYLRDGGEPCRINLGTGRGASVKEIVDIVQAVSGQRVATKALPRRLGDPAALVANPQRARALLGFDAARSDVQTIVKSAWAYHRRRHGKHTL